MADRLVSVDSSTLQFPAAVRNVQAANLGDPTTVEGGALTARLAPKLDSSVASTTYARQSALDSVAALAAAPIPALGGVSVYVCGHSFGTANTAADLESTPALRLSMRHLTKTPAINAVGGSLMPDIQAKVAATWPVNSRGLAFIADGCVNDRNVYGDDAGATTTREAFRSGLAYLTAAAVQSIATAAFSFDTSWSAGASSTVASVFNFAFTGPTAHLLVGYVATAGGTVEIYDGATLLTTITTGGYKRAFTGAVKIAGLGSGTHQLTGKLVSGAATIVGLAIMGDTPPVVVWDNAGNGTGGAAAGARLALYQDTCAQVLPDFPTVVRVPAGSGWDVATMLGDSLHRNDRGNFYAFTQIEAALRAYLGQGFRQGLNALSRMTASTPYVSAIATSAGPPVIVYASDDFNRADNASMGVTPIGGLTWQTACNGTPVVNFRIFANTAVLSANTSAALADAYLDTGSANGTLRALVTNKSGFPGILFRASGTNNADGYVFFANGTSYTLSIRTAGVMTALLSSTTAAPANGDILSVVLNGPSINCKVNGVSVISTTDTAHTGTRHGIVNNSAGGQHDNFYADNAIA